MSVHLSSDEQQEGIWTKQWLPYVDDDKLRNNVCKFVLSCNSPQLVLQQFENDLILIGKNDKTISRYCYHSSLLRIDQFAWHLFWWKLIVVNRKRCILTSNPCQCVNVWTLGCMHIPGCSYCKFALALTHAELFCGELISIEITIKNIHLLLYLPKGVFIEKKIPCLHPLLEQIWG